MITGTSYRDSVYNQGQNVTITTGDGADTVNNYYGHNSTINAGAGNGYVYNSQSNSVSLAGGAGNDSIYNYYGNDVTINAGAGDDSISLSINAKRNVIQYAAGDGNDTVYGYNPSDTISLTGGSITSTSISGNDLILNTSNGSIRLVGNKSANVNGTIYGTYSTVGTSGNDTLTNFSSNVTINALAGNDSIINGGSNVSINTGAGNNTVTNYGLNATVSLGTGNSTVYNYEKAKILGSAGNNYIYNYYAEGSTISGGKGNDTVYNYSNSVSADGGAGNDLIYNNGYYSTINGGAGGDSIYNNGYYSTINGGADGDSIYGYYYSSSINGGAGDDKISLSSSGYNNTVVGGTGNDTIYGATSYGVLYEYGYGDGNDIIEGFKTSDTIKIGNGTTDTFSSIKGSNDVILLVGDGNITLSGAATLSTIQVLGTHVPANYAGLTEGVDFYENPNAGATIFALGGNDMIMNSKDSVSIDGGAGDDYILNQNSYSSATARTEKVTIDGGDGDDTIINWGNHSSIDGGAGNDKITNAVTSSDATLDGGNDDDTIINFGSKASISGGLGNDTIQNDNGQEVPGNKVTIAGGKGDDLISLSSNAANNLIQYTSGDGFDTVIGFNATSTLKIGDGKGEYFLTNSADNKDVVITVDNEKIILVGAASLSTLNIQGTESKIIKLTEGDDTCGNAMSDRIILALAGNDSIFNSGSSVSIDGGAGNDLLENSGSRVTINGGKGDEQISLNSDAKNNLIVYKAGDGNDTISGLNSDDTVSIVGSSNYTRDTLDNNIIISLAGGGSMTFLDASNVSLKGGKLVTDKGIAITNYVPEYTVNGTAHRDTVSNYAGGASITGNNGNDYIYNSTDANYMLDGTLGHVTIDGGAGNDTIINYDPDVSISGGANYDLISLKSSSFGDVTINGGTGNDTIYGNSLGSGDLYQYAKGDGNDLIYNFSSNDTLSISGSAYSTSKSGNDLLVSVESSGIISLIGAADKGIYIYPSSDNEKGKYINNSADDTLLTGSGYADTIKNSGNKVTINAGAGNDTIDGNNDNTTINAGAGKDTITGNHYKSKISGDADNDLISISSFNYNTIDGGKGNDTIIAGGNYHSVNGGAGNDRISLSGDQLTVSGGKGNDTIYGSTATGHLYEYSKGDGKDIIYNYGSNDSITISGITNEEWSIATSGNNVIVSVAGGGNMTLVGAKGKTLNIYPENDEPLTVSADVTPQDIIKKFMGSLDTTEYSGVAALNQAVSVASGGYFTNIGAAIEQMTLDCKTYNDENSSTGWKNFLLEKCGINLDNEDTGAISGADAGTDSVKNASDIVPETGSLESSFTDNNFTVNGLEVQLASINSAYEYTDINYSDLTGDAQKYIWQAFKTWWAKGALDLNAQSYGDNYSFAAPSSTAKKLNFGFVNQSSGLMAVTAGWYADYPSHKTIDRLAMAVNIYNYSSIIQGNADGKMSTRDGYYLDRVLSHEFTHALMYANVDYAGDLPNYIMEGMAELTHGTDDDRKSEITALATNPSGLKNALSYDMYESYAGGYMFLRYLAKQGAEHYPISESSFTGTGNLSVSYSDAFNSNAITVSKGTTMTVSKDFTGTEIDLTNHVSTIKNVDATALAKGIEIIGNTNANSIAAGVGNDTIFSNVGNDTIRGGKGDDILYGEGGNDKLYGDDGDDVISGGTGKDTLTGGTGKDIFVHTVDEDYIADYNSDDDKIQLAQGNIVGSSISSSNFVLNTGTYGTITVANGVDKEITVIDGDGNESTVEAVTFTNQSAAKVTLGANVLAANASKRTAAVTVTGNDQNNYVLGGTKNDVLYGGKGTDTLNGGKGNDKLYGQDGNDSLAGGDGNDTLSGGEGNDKVLGGNGHDKLYGGTGDDSILGGAGNDKLYGEAGNDYLSGEAGNDYLSGGDGNDSILGGAGNDSLAGGKGNDSLWGDAGADTFIYSSGDGNDVIYGFENDDLLKITGTFSASYSKAKSEVYFKVGSTKNAITLSDFTATSFNVNDSIYQINSKNKFVKK